MFRLRYPECVKAPGRDVPRKIRRGEVVGICIAYHEWSKRVPKDEINKLLNEIFVWIKHANSFGIKVVVLGLTGTHWNQSIWEQIETDKVLNVSKHRFCGMNLKLRDAEHPSNLCLKVLSTQVHEPTVCSCGIPFNMHLNDWHPYGDDTDRMNHRDAMMRLYNVLVENGILDFQISGTEHMFPTEERVEWKRKRKENKEKGIEVKKRTKVVEDHFDDCGDVTFQVSQKILWNLRCTC